MNKGLNQSLTIDPRANSFDNDNYIPMNNLTFRFYCKVIQSGEALEYPKKSFNENLDLLTMSSGLYSMSSNTTCFNDSSIFFFFSFKWWIKF
jgi:hypothetical protein